MAIRGTDVDGNSRSKIDGVVVSGGDFDNLQDDVVKKTGTTTENTSATNGSNQ